MRVRRRFLLTITTLLVVCLILFCEDKIEAFAPHIRNFAELKIEDTLNGKVKLSIGSMDGGIMRPIALNDIKIYDSKGGLVFSSVDINSIKTNYRIWDIFIKRKSGSIISNMLARDSSIYINFLTKDDDLSGFVKLDGELDNARVKGCVRLKDGTKIDFFGSARQDFFDIELRPPTGSIKCEGTLLPDGTLSVVAKVGHIALWGYDIVCDALFKGRLASPSADHKASYAEGEFEVKNLILNYDSFLDIKGAYKVSGSILEGRISAGDAFRAEGSIFLRQPHKVNITALANNVSLGWLLMRLFSKDASSIISGTMNGKFDIKGPIGHARSNARIDIKKGTIATLDFDTMSATLKGYGPVIKIEDSRINRQSGYFTLAGEIDLRKMGKESLFQDLRISSDERAITWDGWYSTKTRDSEEVVMEKRINDDINLDFKKFITDNSIDESKRDTDEVHLEYKLQSNNSLKMMMYQDEDFFGLEHKDKF